MDFERFKSRSLLLLDTLLPLADSEIAQRVRGAQARLQAERLKILVIGEFSRGKSTFINALIGQPVLPSKVNPTTATINVISGGDPAQAEVQYEDGTRDTLPLPSERINRFLEGVVTTSNEHANRIQVVRIQLPGKLDDFPIDIVDTPGVNDLDQARETITYKYLREADAAVLLLDAQQPLSESERIFLKEKVLDADVRKILYVINKADEVLLSGTHQDIAKIKGYVVNRLEDLVGEAHPQVFAVSAKSALASRFKGDTSEFASQFDAFEVELVAFATAQATDGRLQAHTERLERICDDQIALLRARDATLAAELGDLQSYLGRLEHEYQMLKSQVGVLQNRLDRAASRLSERVTHHTLGAIHHLQAQLAQELSGCASDEDIERFRRQISHHVRDAVAGLEQVAADERQKLEHELETDFASILASSGASSRQAGKALELAMAGPTIQGPMPVAPARFGLEEAAVGFGLGYIGAAMFGPVGIAAAVMGSYLVSQAKREQQAIEQARQAREAMKQALFESCQQLAERARGVGEEVASREIGRLRDSFMNRAQRQVSQLNAEAQTAKAIKYQSAEERIAYREALQRRISQIETIRLQVPALMR